MTEIEVRGKEVYDLIMFGWTNSRISEHLKNKYGSISDETIQTYVEYARKMANKDFNWTVEDARNALVSRYSHLYEMNLAVGKWEDARKILADIANLYPVKTTKIDVTTNGESLNEQKAIIAKLSIKELEAIDNIYRKIEGSEEPGQGRTLPE